MDDPDLMTIPEVADLLRCPVATIYAWRSRGKGPRSYKIGKRCLYKRADVIEWVDAQ